MTSLKEKQIDKMLDRIIGNGDDALRIVTKLAMTNTEITPEVLATLDYLKKQNEEDAKAINDELEMTLDASGNLVRVECLPALTFTIDNGVINNVNGIINVENESSIYRLPVGKT
jgi:hypothetical protein